MSMRFSVGDRVRVADMHPPGHRRTPFYARGKEGVVESIPGEFLNAEELGHGADGLPKKRLYRVRFRQQDLWSRYTGSEADTVDVDIYEHWLAMVAEPAPQAVTEAGR